LPWLQDSSAENVRDQWKVTYRDVIILDPLNRMTGLTLNLTRNNLADLSQREELKKRLRKVAEFQDQDQDGLGDDWEERHFGGLGAVPTDDAQNGQGDLFLSYALGLTPGIPGTPAVGTSIEGEGNGRFFEITYRRRLGMAGGLRYEWQSWGPGEGWQGVGEGWSVHEVRPIWDGTGTEIVVLRSPVETSGARILRVEVRGRD
jgi:hypothetical protein